LKRVEKRFVSTSLIVLHHQKVEERALIPPWVSVLPMRIVLREKNVVICSILGRESASLREDVLCLPPPVAMGQIVAQRKRRLVVQIQIVKVVSATSIRFAAWWRGTISAPSVPRVMAGALAAKKRVVAVIIVRAKKHGCLL